MGGAVSALSPPVSSAPFTPFVFCLSPLALRALLHCCTSPRSLAHPEPNPPLRRLADLRRRHVALPQARHQGGQGAGDAQADRVGHARRHQRPDGRSGQHLLRLSGRRPRHRRPRDRQGRPRRRADLLATRCATPRPPSTTPVWPSRAVVPCAPSHPRTAVSCRSPSPPRPPHPPTNAPTTHTTPHHPPPLPPDPPCARQT